MATIRDLVLSVSEMSEEHLFEHIRNVRKRRRTPIIKETKAKKSSPKASVDTLVSKMSESERENLIKLLEGS